MAKFEFIQWLYDFLVNANELFFDWDDGNEEKSFEKHGIELEATESVFFDKYILALGSQISPNVNESRFGIIGKDKFGRILFISFTFRSFKIRPISARRANKKERETYEKAIC